ncbi:sugar phosphate isomerase/epimerase family protein [Fuerstiella marisgermanici]|uniref:Xylose isomerase-like TIM barrel n=1 Tax=Fuerstiella marisgermanici TaxID=1891926 RepID=A0A1P8WHJ8_9PLAN|nr:TIM barrel protein [Fuerstiella marisgermanici]APZ93528.1 Xylose isomerase-like TIM barrel [Fuerstiella marisgermanici]
MQTTPLNRRTLFCRVATAAMTLPIAKSAVALDDERDEVAPTKFQLGCMTLPYAAFPLQRALESIAGAGYRHVAWGTSHRETDGGEKVPVMPTDASPQKASELAKRCRDLELNPVMMFSTVYPEAPNAMEVLTQRIKQAEAAGISQVLTFGHTKGGNRALWVKRFQQLGPIARDNNVLLVVKQHGGSTGTGRACAQIIREVNDEGVKVNYDAGNVMDYLNVDPIPDIKTCADVVHSFCLKDHRNWPKDEDCGPGFGEIDHYKLLHPVAFTGRTIPLCCENIFAPNLPRPSKPEGIDRLAKQVRQYMEVVIAGTHRRAVGVGGE